MLVDGNFLVLPLPSDLETVVDGMISYQSILGWLEDIQQGKKVSGERKGWYFQKKWLARRKGQAGERKEIDSEYLGERGAGQREVVGDL